MAMAMACEVKQDATGTKWGRVEMWRELFSAEDFECAVCKELAYKPVVNVCGHMFCFMCVHQAMSPIGCSYCPLCRRRFSHLPRVCELLDNFLSTTFPKEYEERAREGVFDKLLEPLDDDDDDDDGGYGGHNDEEDEDDVEEDEDGGGADAAASAEVEGRGGNQEEDLDRDVDEAGMMMAADRSDDSSTPTAAGAALEPISRRLGFPASSITASALTDLVRWIKSESEDARSREDVRLPPPCIPSSAAAATPSGSDLQEATPSFATAATLREEGQGLDSHVSSEQEQLSEAHAVEGGWMRDGAGAAQASHHPQHRSAVSGEERTAMMLHLPGQTKRQRGAAAAEEYSRGGDDDGGRIVSETTARALRLSEMGRDVVGEEALGTGSKGGGEGVREGGRGDNSEGIADSVLEEAAAEEESRSSGEDDSLSGRPDLALFRCGMCQNLLIKPVILNCGHGFCCVCAQSRGTPLICAHCGARQPERRPESCRILQSILDTLFPEEVLQRQIELKGKSTAAADPAGPAAVSSGGRHLSEEEDDNDWISCNDRSVNTGERGNDNERRDDTSGAPASSLDQEDRRPRRRQRLIHPQYGCDGCGAYPIVGRRYRCLDCRPRIGYDLCGECYDRRYELDGGRFNQGHRADHRMVERDKFALFFSQLGLDHWTPDQEICLVWLMSLMGMPLRTENIVVVRDALSGENEQSASAPAQTMEEGNELSQGGGEGGGNEEGGEKRLVGTVVEGRVNPQEQRQLDDQEAGGGGGGRNDEDGERRVVGMVVEAVRHEGEEERGFPAQEQRQLDGQEAEVGGREDSTGSSVQEAAAHRSSPDRMRGYHCCI